MKISDLKQPYRRMAEYLAERNTNTRRNYKTALINSFDWGLTNVHFWSEVYDGNHPEITPEIKTNFPADFDFSGEEGNNTKSITLSEFELLNLILETHTELSKMGATGMVSTGRVILKNIDKVANLNKENQRKIEDENLQKRIYTQLAKEGKFDELPDTCEFSEAVELEVKDYKDAVEGNLLKVVGKYKGKYVVESENFVTKYAFFNLAQLPTQKIDFSEFKNGDVVEVELIHNETRIGWFDYVDTNHVVINVLKRKGNQVCNGGSCAGSKMLNKEKIKSITKIK